MGGASCVPDNKWGSSNGHHLALTNTTGSAMVLSMATLVGFLPQAVLGSAIGVLVDRWNRKWS